MQYRRFSQLNTRRYLAEKTMHAQACSPKSAYPHWILTDFLLTIPTLNPKSVLKRFLSIVFLVLFLFNLGGYYIVFWGMENQARKDLLQRLDASDYSEKDLMVLTIPMSLPYPMIQNTYERVNGEFIHGGKTYKLVKQKIENDTVFIVCIHDKKASKIASALSDYSKIANDVPTDSQQALNLLAKLYKDYNTSEFTLMYKSRFLFERTYYATNTPSIVDQSVRVDSPPPENTI